MTGYIVGPKTNISPGSGNPSTVRSARRVGRLSRSPITWSTIMVRTAESPDSKDP